MVMSRSTAANMLGKCLHTNSKWQT
jgi:hypothetical protein